MAQPQAAFSMPPLPPMQPMNDNTNGPRIKSEPGLENGMQPGAPLSFNSGMTAQQRAAQNLQATYGSRAAASINAIQGGMPQHNLQNQQQQNMQQQPQHGTPESQAQRAGPRAYMPNMSQAQYNQAVARTMVAQQGNSHTQQGGVNGAQTDGSGDMEESIGIMKRVNAQGEEVEMGRIEIDNIIREKIEAMGRSMEGGGLMLPLKERYPAGRSKKRKVAPIHPLVAAQSSSAGPQYDGGDDDDDDDDKSGILKDEEDEDAINSDLDDPDDGLNDEEDDDEGMGHIMLCMYDKVQRVKNKWYAFFCSINMILTFYLGSAS